MVNEQRSEEYGKRVERRYGVGDGENVSTAELLAAQDLSLVIDSRRSDAAHLPVAQEQSNVVLA